jgi:RNA binding exosome subunit
MKRPFSSLHARALCHATEVLDRVKQAVVNAISEVELDTKRTTGHHGNEILVVEAHTTDARAVTHLFENFSPSDRHVLLETLSSRLDGSCNLFLRIDKQSAFGGKVVLATTEDAIAIRLKVNAYPAKQEIAMDEAAGFLSGLNPRG